MSAAIDLARRVLARGAAGIGHDAPRIGPAQLAAWLTEDRAVQRPVFWVLYSGYRLRTPIGVTIAAVLALAFSFNGLALAIARYPHFELLIVGMALLFFVALSQGRLATAAICFTICLATREDAGFHLFAILSLLIGLNRWRGISWHEQRHEVAFSLLALAYSIGALAL